MSQNINLYDSSLRQQRDWLSPRLAITAMAAGVALTSLATSAMRWELDKTKAVADKSSAEFTAQQTAIKQINERAAGVKPDVALQTEVTRAQRLLTQRRAALKALDTGAAGGESGFAAHLEALARQSIEGVWLTGVSLKRDDVLLRGRAMNPALIPAYVQRLEHEPSLQGRAFKALDVSRPLDEKAKTTGTATADADGSAPRAEYVDFKLTGSSRDDLAVVASGTKP